MNLGQGHVDYSAQAGGSRRVGKEKQRSRGRCREPSGTGSGPARLAGPAENLWKQNGPVVPPARRPSGQGGIEAAPGWPEARRVASENADLVSDQVVAGAGVAQLG